MGRLISGTASVILAALLTACSSMSGTDQPTIASRADLRSASPTSPPTTSGRTVTTPLALTSTPASPTLPMTPTVVGTPTATVTPGPPTATPTPAPGEATLSAAEQVDQALVAFAQAEASGDAGATLQAQRKLLDAATNASTIAAADQTTYGRALQSALDAIQAAAGGDEDRLNDAHKALLQIEGSSATPVALPRRSSRSHQNLSDVAQSLKRAVEAYDQANRTGTADDVLRAQRDLINATTAAEAATRNNHSPLAQQIQTALTAIHDGLAGDTGKFRDAESDLATLSTLPEPTASPTGTATPSPTPSPSPTLSPSPSPTASATPGRGTSGAVNLQPLQNDLDNQLQALQNEIDDQNKDNLHRAQKNLHLAIQKASDALASDHSPAADRFRDGLNLAQAAAAGDWTKIQVARDQLKAATNGS